MTKQAIFEKIIKQDSATKAYNKKLQTILAAVEAYEAKKAKAQTEAEELADQLRGLDFQFFSSLDDNEIIKLRQQRNEVRQLLEDAKGVSGFNVAEEVKRQFNAVEADRAAAHDERNKVGSAAVEARQEIEQAAKAAINAINQASQAFSSPGIEAEIISIIRA